MITFATKEHHNEDFHIANGKATNAQSGSTSLDPSRKKAQKEQVVSKSGQTKVSLAKT
jgi:hypothetical protein